MFFLLFFCIENKTTIEFVWFIFTFSISILFAILGTIVYCLKLHQFITLIFKNIDGICIIVKYHYWINIYLSIVSFLSTIVRYFIIHSILIAAIVIITLQQSITFIYNCSRNICNVSTSANQEKLSVVMRMQKLQRLHERTIDGICVCELQHE